MANPEEVDPSSKQPELWSRADYRTLIITFGSTLAANLATILIGGLAIIFVRYVRHDSNTAVWILYAAVTVLATGAAIFCTILFHRMRAREGTTSFATGCAMVMPWLAAVTLWLIWIGIAAGIK